MINLTDLPTLWQIATALDAQQETIEKHDALIIQQQMLIDKLTQTNWEQAKVIDKIITQIKIPVKKCE